MAKSNNPGFLNLVSNFFLRKNAKEAGIDFLYSESELCTLILIFKEISSDLSISKLSATKSRRWIIKAKLSHFKRSELKTWKIVPEKFVWSGKFFKKLFFLKYFLQTFTWQPGISILCRNIPSASLSETLTTELRIGVLARSGHSVFELLAIQRFWALVLFRNHDLLHWAFQAH